MSDTTAAVTVSKGDLRKAATAFAARWADATSEKSHSQSFWNEFLAIFGLDHKYVAVYEALAEKSTGGHGWIDLLVPGKMGVEHKSTDPDGGLDAAMDQLVNYLPNLEDGLFPTLLVVCDFQTFRWRDLDRDLGGEFALADLPGNIDLFAWLAGHAQPGVHYETDEDVNLKATRLLSDVHDRLADTGYDTHALREWMTRLLFCLFADDTGVWDRGAFHNSIALHTRPDGRDLGTHIDFVFDVLNLPYEKRQTNLGEEFAPFIYINGELFEGRLTPPMCDAQIRTAILEACKFDWSAISPAIFGSMFQNVMDAPERRQLGAHYTTEGNILRTIRPLFLDRLEADLDAATTKPALRKFLDDLAELKFFDPACGCGNFLVIAYREIRRLETEGLRRLYTKQGKTGQLAVDIALQCQVTVDQFHGIEIEEFPAKIARTALYLMDHQCNRQVSAEFGQHFVRFPIPAAPHIVNANALDTDWDDVLPADDCGYCFGNPPYVGFTLRDETQKADHDAILGEVPGGKKLDYVANWFALAATYGKDRSVRFAFVATNSLTQGDQASILGPYLDTLGFDIDFAHRTFKWLSEASGTAAVHVVIVGFSHGGSGKTKTLWDYSHDARAVDGKVSTANNINWYLVDAPDVYPQSRPKPLSPDLPEVWFGSRPVDGGHLIVKPDTYDEVAGDPHAVKYLRRFVGAKELLHSLDRWCLWMPDLNPADVKASPVLKARLTAVRENRQQSKETYTRELANTPHMFYHSRQPESPYVCIPAHVSENRHYWIVDHFGPEVITSNANFTAEDPDGFLFSIISSSMFIAWQRAVGGKIKSDLRFSKKPVWNTLPLPPVDISLRTKIIAAGKGVLKARAKHPGRSLAEQYEPLAMDQALVKAHQELDRHVDRAFGASRRCSTEQARQQILFDRYLELTDVEK